MWCKRGRLVSKPIVPKRFLFFGNESKSPFSLSVEFVAMPHKMGILISDIVFPSTKNIKT
jgi:hypothetical protein